MNPQRIAPSAPLRRSESGGGVEVQEAGGQLLGLGRVLRGMARRGVWAVRSFVAVSDTVRAATWQVRTSEGTGNGLARREGTALHRFPPSLCSARQSDAQLFYHRPPSPYTTDLPGKPPHRRTYLLRSRRPPPVHHKKRIPLPYHQPLVKPVASERSFSTLLHPKQSSGNRQARQYPPTTSTCPAGHPTRSCYCSTQSGWRRCYRTRLPTERRADSTRSPKLSKAKSRNTAEVITGRTI